MRKLRASRVVPGSGEIAIDSSSASVATMLLLPLFGCPTMANVGWVGRAARDVVTRHSPCTELGQRYAQPNLTKLCAVLHPPVRQRARLELRRSNTPARRPHAAPR